MEILNDNFSAKRSLSRLETHERGWTEGEVVTPHGIVSAYAQGESKANSYTKLEFAFERRHYIRSFMNKRYSEMGIVTKANQFVEEIISGQQVDALDAKKCTVHELYYEKTLKCRKCGRVIENPRK